MYRSKQHIFEYLVVPNLSVPGAVRRQHLPFRPQLLEPMLRLQNPPLQHALPINPSRLLLRVDGNHLLETDLVLADRTGDPRPNVLAPLRNHY